MHYENGRPVEIGDWVIGPTHNSSHMIRVGVVVELMPQQGPCNVRLHVWRDEHYAEEGNPVRIPAIKSRGADDYADAAMLIHALDGYRMVAAIEGNGKWNAPYFGVSMEQAGTK